MAIDKCIKELHRKMKLTQEDSPDKMQISRSALANNELISIDHYKNLPSIARKEIEDYIEFILHKYGKGKD